MRSFVRSLPLLVSVLLCPTRALAHASGAVGGGCSSCHTGGKTPTVSITSMPLTAAPGQLVTLTVSISPTNGNTAGFYLRANGGVFSVIDASSKLSNGGV